MKVEAPAKTFLVGEYASVVSGSAILLTTSPCFSTELTSSPNLLGIHPQSPAGLFWDAYNKSEYNLEFYDPYNTKGGLGASSAQFVGAYFLFCKLEDKKPHLKELLLLYQQFASTKSSVMPSGYDVIAQSLDKAVFVNKSRQEIKSIDWKFSDLDFLVIRTGFKLATHEHLLHLELPKNISYLTDIVDNTFLAMHTNDSHGFVTQINKYYDALIRLNLVWSNTIDLIKKLQATIKPLAIKGCGAMGADTILVVFAKAYLANNLVEISNMGLEVIASSIDLYQRDKKKQEIAYKDLKFY